MATGRMASKVKLAGDAGIDYTVTAGKTASVNISVSTNSTIPTKTAILGTNATYADSSYSVADNAQEIIFPSYLPDSVDTVVMSIDKKSYSYSDGTIIYAQLPDSYFEWSYNTQTAFTLYEVDPVNMTLQEHNVAAINGTKNVLLDISYFGNIDAGVALSGTVAILHVMDGSGRRVTIDGSAGIVTPRDVTIETSAASRAAVVAFGWTPITGIGYSSCIYVANNGQVMGAEWGATGTSSNSLDTSIGSITTPSEYIASGVAGSNVFILTKTKILYYAKATFTYANTLLSYTHNIEDPQALYYDPNTSKFRIVAKDGIYATVGSTINEAYATTVMAIPPASTEVAHTVYGEPINRCNSLDMLTGLANVDSFYIGGKMYPAAGSTEYVNTFPIDALPGSSHVEVTGRLLNASDAIRVVSDADVLVNISGVEE